MSVIVQVCQMGRSRMLCKILNVNLGRGLGTQYVLHVPQPVGEMGKTFPAERLEGPGLAPHSVLCRRRTPSLCSPGLLWSLFPITLTGSNSLSGGAATPEPLRTAWPRTSDPAWDTTACLCQPLLLPWPSSHRPWYLLPVLRPLISGRAAQRSPSHP